MKPLTGSEITEKIISLYPEFASKEAHLSVHYDESVMAWDVDITKHGQHHHTYLDIFETQACLAQGKCIPLSFQLGEIHEHH